MEVPAIGDVIDARYRLEEAIGEGGTAIVFRAWDATASRPVALKLFKPGRHGYDEATQRRFEREVRIIANLTNPHTVTLFDSGRTGDFLYMVFELVGGEDLAEHLAKHGRLAPHDVRHVLVQLLSSLHEAHTNGLLHRDIKPDNVRIYVSLTSLRTVKLLDFGIARASDTNASITKTGELVGTPRYMSPEALMEKSLSAASDIYSVGILALEMLYGRDALHGDRWDDQFDRLIDGHVFSFENDDVPPELRAIVDRMCAQDAAERYQSAGAALHALRALRFDDEEATRVADPSSRSADTSAQRPAQSPPSGPPPSGPPPSGPPPSGPPPSGPPPQQVPAPAPSSARAAQPPKGGERQKPSKSPRPLATSAPTQATSQRFRMRKRDLILTAIGVFALTLIIAILVNM